MVPTRTVRRSSHDVLLPRPPANSCIGQPIRLRILPARNPFDNAVMPGKPLADRISAPGERRRNDDDDAARRGIDRYIPPGGRNRSRSPGGGQRRGGRRPGARREGGGRDGEARGGRGNPRAKKTAQELDDDMADYFTGGNNEEAQADTAVAAPAAAPAAAPTGDDVDMIE